MLAETYAKEVAEDADPRRRDRPRPHPHRMRAQAMPGEDPDTLPHPSEIVPYLIEMASPNFERTNVRFEFPTKSYIEQSLAG